MKFFIENKRSEGGIIAISVFAKPFMSVLGFKCFNFLASMPMQIIEPSE